MKAKVILISGLILASLIVQAQEQFNFEIVNDLETTTVKSQGMTGTCWAYSTISFIESEIIRMGGPSINLSEMYIVKHAYQNKAKQYVYRHGIGNFSQGGQAHDVLKVISEHGFVPEQDYWGRKDTSLIHNHSDLEPVLKAMLDTYMTQKGASPEKQWFDNLDAVLTAQLGKTPTRIMFNKRTYSPAKFADALGFRSDNYIELTSYTHHTYNKPFVLEVPDNWSNDSYYNVELNDLIGSMKEALDKGYTIVWDGDVSEEFFSHKEGIALLPLTDTLGFVPQVEEVVTPEMRQESFINWNATDDHLMHIVGMVKDGNGTIYFKTKNSWGNTSNTYGGYLYMSEAYVRMNTVAIMMHKDALNKTLHKKLLGKNN